MPNMRDPWYAEMAERYRKDHPPEPVPLVPDPVPPPDDGLCLDCYEWHYYPGGQRHFGQAWFRLCSWECPHDHHRDEVWLAAA